jgi:hypothetical protein
MTDTRQLRHRARRQLAAESACVALAVALVYWALHPDPLRSLGTLFDDVVYVSLGRSIATGAGYRALHLVGAPVHEKFPPGVPLLYALCWRVMTTLPGTLALGMAITASVVVLAGAVLWTYSRAILGNGRLTTGVFVALPLVLATSIRYYEGAASEPWFLLAWAVALLLAARLRAGSVDRGGATTAVALGLTLAAGALFRTQAVVLLPALLLALAVRRVPWRLVAAVGAAAMLPLLAWRLWLAAAVRAGPRAVQGDQLGYLGWLPHESFHAAVRFAAAVVAYNARSYLGVAPVIVGGASVRMLGIVLCVLALAAVGASRTWRQHPELATTLGASLAVVLVWPFVQDRFVMPLLPVIGLLAAIGAQAVLAGRPPAVRLAAAAAGALVAAFAMRGVPRSIVAALRDPAARDTLIVGALYQQRSAEVVGWVAVNTRPEDRVLVDVGGVVYLRTGRRTVVAVPEEPHTGPSVMRPVGRYLANRLLADSVDYVVVWRYKSPTLLAQVGRVELACPGTFELRPPVVPTTTPQFIRYFRVWRDEACLRRLVRELATR